VIRFRCLRCGAEFKSFREFVAHLAEHARRKPDGG